MRWFTADLHFGHARILDYCDRPWSDIEEHDQGLIDNFNELIWPEDELWILGDAAMGKIAETIPKIDRINGRKYLVMGNHDRPWKGHKRPTKHDLYLDVFTVLTDSAHVRIGPHSVELSHFPYDGDSHEEERFAEHRPTDRGRWLLHGHVHESRKFGERQINVGVDVHDYKPVSDVAILHMIEEQEHGPDN